jgi:hypothetical protein
MNKFLSLFIIIVIVDPIYCFAQEAIADSAINFKGELTPTEVGIRYDDNVFRSIFSDGRLSDGIVSLDLGGNLNGRYDIFGGKAEYHLDADQYHFYPSLNNLKNDFSLFLSAQLDDFSFYVKTDYFLRASQYYFFNYWENENLLGVQWAPKGPWIYEAQCRYFMRDYFDNGSATYNYLSSQGAESTGSFQVPTLDYVDQGAFLSVGREIGDKFSLKLEGNYNNRQLNHFGLESPNQLLPYLQTDETWTLLLKAHIYFESVLQEITLEEQRTNSNSYSFSNTVKSASWASIVKPLKSFYLEMLVRLYSKNYDITPLTFSGLQVGYVDEDSEDMISLKANWEFSPQWTASIGYNQVHTESIQPGEYFIKNIISTKVQRDF